MWIDSVSSIFDRWNYKLSMCLSISFTAFSTSLIIYLRFAHETEIEKKQEVEEMPKRNEFIRARPLCNLIESPFRSVSFFSLRLIVDCRTLCGR